MIRLPIDLPHHAHAMCIAPGALRDLGTLVCKCVQPSRAVLAVDNAITDTHGEIARRSLEAAGLSVVTHRLTATESAKSLATVEQMYAAMLNERMDRHSAVIGLGGGIVTDVAGFVAATYLRGVTLINVPTTLLGMVDAAIGGKTGVNFPLPGGGLGKNLVGAFWQPRRIIADPMVLATLAERDYRCGLAECIKHALIARPDLLDDMPSIADQHGAGGSAAGLAAFIGRSAAVKIDIICRDEREAGRRALLNLGHTFAHAFESCPSLALRHGEAVAIGVCAAAHCSVATGRMTPADQRRLTDVVAACGLPTALSTGSEVPSVGQLLDTMAHDKKVERGRWRLVLPVGIGRAEIVDEVDRAIIADALTAVGAGPHHP